jgi:RNA polymerase sigma factor (sigma-70 family)
LHQRLFGYLDQDPEKALEKYRVLRDKLVRYFDHNRCLDPEDLADEVFCRALVRLAGGLEIFAADPTSFFWGIARNLLHESRRHSAQEQLDLDSPKIPSIGPGATTNAAFLAQCLATLKPSERALLLMWYSQGVVRVSRRLGVSRNTIELRVHRIRRKLKELVRPARTEAGHE